MNIPSCHSTLFHSFLHWLVVIHCYFETVTTPSEALCYGLGIQTCVRWIRTLPQGSSYISSLVCAPNFKLFQNVMYPSEVLGLVLFSSKILGFQIQICNLLILRFWARCWTSAYGSVFWSKMWVTTVAISQSGPQGKISPHAYYQSSCKCHP